MKRYLLFLLLCTNILHANIPTTVEKRDEQCKEILRKAAYADISYQKKIELYDELLPLITFGVSDSIENKYIAGLRKLYHARDSKHTANNQLLEKLFARAKNIEQLSNAHEDLQVWLDKVTQENTSHALTTENIIALYLPQLHGYLHLKKESDNLTLQAAPFSEDAPESPPAILFSFAEENNSTLENGKSYKLKPLYSQQDAYSYPCNIQTPFSITLKKNNSHVKNLYDKDHVQLIFNDPSQTEQINEAWAKIERISPEQMHEIENSYFAQKIKNAHMDSSVANTMKIINDHLTLFNERITHSHKELVMKKLRALIEKHESLPLTEQQQLRLLCARTIQKLPSCPEKKECKQHLATINKTLEQEGLQFDDTIVLKNSGGALLCTKYNPESQTEPITIHERAIEATSADHAIQYIKIASPSQKKGTIRYGDEVTFIPLYGSTHGTLTMLNLTDGFARRQKEYRGTTLSYLGCAPISHSMPGSQKTTFILNPPSDLTYLQKNGSCYTPDDPCVLMHQASQEYIKQDPNAPIMQQYTFDKNGSLFSCLKPSKQDLALINESLINQEYIACQNQKTPAHKINKLKKLSNLFTAHETQHAEPKVWNLFNDLFTQKNDLSSQELIQFHTHLKKVIPHLHRIDYNAKKELLTHSAFYTKFRLAQEQSGALRLAAYQSLIPYLKHPSIKATYKNELLSHINGLYERKSTELSTIHNLVDLAVTETTKEQEV